MKSSTVLIIAAWLTILIGVFFAGADAVFSGLTLLALAVICHVLERIEEQIFPKETSKERKERLWREYEESSGPPGEP